MKVLSHALLLFPLFPFKLSHVFAVVLLHLKIASLVVHLLLLLLPKFGFVTTERVVHNVLNVWRDFSSVRVLLVRDKKSWVIHGKVHGDAVVV